MSLSTRATTAREALNGQLAQETETADAEETTARTAVDAVLESAATEEKDAVDETEETKPAAATDEVSEEVAEGDTETVPALPQIETPFLFNNPDYTARIFITAFEHSVNDRHERVTFMRFDAIIPLMNKEPEPVEETTTAIIADGSVVVEPTEDDTPTAA